MGKINLKFFFQTLLYLVFITSFTSCGTLSVQKEGQPSRIAENGITGKWRLQSINQIDFSKLEDMNDSQRTLEQLTLEFDNNNRVQGTTSCNSFVGAIRFDDTRINFNRLKSTSKMCYGSMMDIENIIMNILYDTNNYSIKENTLYLKYNNIVLAVYIAIN